MTFVSLEKKRIFCSRHIYAFYTPAKFHLCCGLRQKDKSMTFERGGIIFTSHICFYLSRTTAAGGSHRAKLAWLMAAAELHLLVRRVVVRPFIPMR
jgi:hypothetical protein